MSTALLHRIAYLTRIAAPHTASVAALAAFGLLLRLIRTSAPSPLITDYAHVARNVDHGEFDEYDFIIVGGGTAGCVLAARLSERPDIRVLLIEAGQSGNAIMESRMPIGFSKIFRGPHDYNLYTEPQQHAANKKKFWPRARLLGGCSAINAMMAHYGAPSDYDEFADIIGDDSWSWNNFETYFRKFENYTPDPRFPHVDASLRGSHGPVTIGYHAYIWEGGPLFVDAAINAGVPFSPDFTTSNGTLGTNKIMTYIDGNRQRVSAESAYLTPQVLARSNLKVVTLARVTKIIFDSSSGTPRAIAVEFANSNQRAPPFRARARKEVIVCGGAVHTPQILMLSGIGPASLLKKHNIPVLIDSPGVGANLTDHPVFNLRLKDKLGISINYTKPHDLFSTFKFLKALVQYQIFRTGPLSSNLGEAVAFFRTDDQKLFPPAEYNNDIEDTTSAPNAPDIEVIIVPAPLHDHNSILEFGLHGYTILTTLLRQVSFLPDASNTDPNLSPTSVGSIQLKSADPWDDPLIDPNYLATRHDLDALIRGVRGAYKIAHTAPFTNITDVGSTHPLLDHHFDRLSDKELSETVRNRVETLYHPFGTCTMGKVDNPAAVLDTQLRVRGALGLRVCDASVYPKLVSGHTTASVLAAAEKLADIIKAEYPATV